MARCTIHAGLALLTATCFAPGALAQSGVDVQLEQFGVGNAWRPGDPTGIQLLLTSREPGEEQYWIEWDLPTADGDVAEYGRRIALTPGQPRDAWLYGPLRPWVTDETGMLVRVRELDDGEPGDTIAVYRFIPRNVAPIQIHPTSSLLGVIGTRRAGLDQYSAPGGNLNQRPKSANEATAVIAIPELDLLPDRWEGLQSYEALVWTDLEPDLRPSQETALVEWIRRGGHLVIVLPETGNPWNLGSSIGGPLADLMPPAPRRDESIPIGMLLPELVKGRTPAQASSRMAMRTFRDLHGSYDALTSQQQWESVHALADGRVYAIQRPVGHGRITVIGLDIASEKLALLGMQLASNEGSSIRSVPEADRFWNRILGRRVDTPDQVTLTAMEEAEVLNTTRPTGLMEIDDRLVSEPIAMSEQAGTGLMLAFIFFMAYWLIAVPGTWWYLGKRNLRQWSWPAFMAWGIVFTIFGWLLVESMQDRNIRVQHITVLDHVYNEDGQRAVSWLSIYTPGYGDRMIELEQDRDARNLLASWSAAGSEQQAFSDSTNFSVDLERRPDRAILPSRGTTMDLHANWLGTVDRNDWGGLIRVQHDDPIVVRRDGKGKEIGLEGTILSDLPGDLQQVRITWIHSNRYPEPGLAGTKQNQLPWVNPLQAGVPPNRGYVWAQGTLHPGQRIDLAQMEPQPSHALKRHIESTYLPTEDKGFDIKKTIGDEQRRKELEILTWYQQLPPPAYHRSGEEFTKTGMTRRSVGRELDLSPWLTRPCLIVTGFLEKSELPFPVLIDGDDEAATSEGLIMVRWIFPLPQHDPVAFEL